MFDRRSEQDAKNGSNTSEKQAPKPASARKDEQEPAPQGAKNTSSAASGPVAPVPSLPKGGGAIRGIGEKFSVSPATGTGSLAVPILTSPGRGGFHPELVVAYDSGAGNGPFGHGFHLSIPQVTRKTDKGLPQYNDAGESDTFIFSGAEDLVPKLYEDPESTGTWKPDSFHDGDEWVERFVPRIEGSFIQIERRTESNGNVYWKATTGDNKTSVYGRSPLARIANPARPKEIFTWLLEETRDDKGNVIKYFYRPEDREGVPVVPWEAHRRDGFASAVNLYPKRIRYGNTVPFDATDDLESAAFEVIFDYGDHDADVPTVVDSPYWPARPDPFSTYRAGFEIRTYRLCQRVLMFHWMPELGEQPCLVASTDFAYTPDAALTHLASVTHTGYVRAPDGAGYTKKSRPALEFGYSSAEIQTTIGVVDKGSLGDLPFGVQGHHQWVDLDGEALPGVLSEEAGALRYKQNLGGGKLAPARVLKSQPSLSGGGLQLLDLDGDGRKELVVFDRPMAGYHDRTEDGSWAPFRGFPAQPVLDFHDPNLRFIDLSGDGHEDVLITRGDALVWYPSLAKGGFDRPRTFHTPHDERKGPVLVFADGTQSIFLADMSGDGLTDLVRIRNGSIAYWPNLGHGRFGAKVQMDGKEVFDHPDQFDPRRIRLADVDGTGTTDVLYLHRDGARIYPNLAGNSLGAPTVLPRLPDQSALSTVAALDLLGSGTACLVWSSPLPGYQGASIRYLDLLGSTKPHLLVSVKNNLGLETTLTYAPSTKFYRQDAEAGRPWVTRLPFVVHVLEKVETWDAVSRHRFVSTYAYHHGYFDGAEREFRGFGMVEQRDAESFSAFSGKGQPVANASDPELHLPPVVTKTWFHTGAWKAGAEFSSPYEHEYFKGDTQAVLLKSAPLPDGLSLEEQREAARALKGQTLRQEIYAEDGSLVEKVPYLVSQKSYDIRRLQPVVRRPKRPAISYGIDGDRTHGVFFSHPREAVEYHYERAAADPRITHALTLQVDDHGVVTRSAMVGYPRRAQAGLPAEQLKLAVTLSEVDVVHHAPLGVAGWYRVGVPIETRTYELTGIEPTDAIFEIDDVRLAAAGAVEIAYDQSPDGTSQKRLLSQSRTLYLDDDLTGPLPMGTVESLALPYESYAKAFTPALLAGALGDRATDAIMAEGGYVRLPGDDAWWVPSGRQVFSGTEFYMPVAFISPFGATTTVVYDATYHLFAEQVTDAVGNTVSAQYDLRTLSPWEVTDPNGNRARARFDALGLVVATAVMGKVGESDGDTLDDPTSTFAYDLTRFASGQGPNVVHVRARELHGAANVRWQESYSYSDGSGHEVGRKVLAEPGLAPVRDGNGGLVHGTDGELVLVTASPRWVGSGRTVFDNKGNPVKQYEPFFSDSYAYEDEPELAEQGVTAIMRYDPLGRLIRTDLPNGTFSRVEFDPWQEVRYDPNDTVLESGWYAGYANLDPVNDPKGRAAANTAAHANTPARVHLDALGRPFLTIEDNGGAEKYETRVVLDIEGNALSITDHRGVVVQESRYGMGGAKLYQKSCDAGERRMLADVGGALLRAWDERGFSRRARYDDLRRPTHLYVLPLVGAEFLAERTVYGEALGASATTLNLRGRPYQHYDGAGVVTSLLVDFKGNMLQSERRLAKAYKTQVDWMALDMLDDPAAIAFAAGGLLEIEAFAASTEYDALNRPISMITPDASEIRPTYNEAGLLDKVEARVRGAATWTPFVDNIDYDAKGQREKIVYSGGATYTEYEYDDKTFRLTHLVTTRALGNKRIQELSYTYDPVGNITEIVDAAQQEVFFDGDEVQPKMAYVYDALYRLTSATGREHASTGAYVQPDENDAPIKSLPHANDVQALRTYTESYEYDAVGNILRMIHDSGAPETSWTRRYDVSTTSNRLLRTSVAGDMVGQFSALYGYDDHGNMISMPHLAAVGWNHRDEMVSADKGGGGIVYFTYDAGGERVRKVYEHNGLIEERIYLGGFEIYRKRLVSAPEEIVLERETLHMMDGVRRIAMVETKTIDEAAGGGFQATTVTRFQLGNHLGSASLEVDAGGLLISYEEYHPYGTTAYWSASGAVEVSKKRYRYTGKEKDEETGLYYHGARYYAPWLGRWTGCDPLFPETGPNSYVAMSDDPVGRIDDTGAEDKRACGSLCQDVAAVNNLVQAIALPVTGPLPALIALGISLITGRDRLGNRIDRGDIARDAGASAVPVLGALYSATKGTMAAADHAKEASRAYKRGDARTALREGVNAAAETWQVGNTLGLEVAVGAGAPPASRDRLYSGKPHSKAEAGAAATRAGAAASHVEPALQAPVPLGLTPDQAAKIADALKTSGAEPPRLHRVQGGGAPGATSGKVSKPLISVSQDGTATIQRKTLNVSDLKHAKYYLEQRRLGGEVVSVAIPQWLADFIKETAIPQKNYQTNPRNQGGLAPKVVDPHKPGVSFELPKIWASWIEENQIKGAATKTPPPHQPPPKP